MYAPNQDENRYFDPEIYLRTRFYDVNVKDRVQFQLESFHEAFNCLPTSLKVLDYGTGPALLSVISAAGHASEIVLSDYSKSNRDTLKDWLENDTTAFNWSPFFDHVVTKLEGKSEVMARKREEDLKRVVKDVAVCDIKCDPPVDSTCPGPYDIVLDSLCLGDACHTVEEFKSGIVKLLALLKPGGTMMTMLSERKMNTETGKYTVGSKEISLLNITGSFVVDFIKELGFSDVTLKTCSVDNKTTKEYQDQDFLGYAFITTRKAP